MSGTRSLGWIVFFLLLFGGVGYFWISLTTTPTQKKPLPPTRIVTKPMQPSISVFPSLSGSASANIIVNKPISQQTVGNAFVVSGETRVFENVVSIQLKNSQNTKILVDTTTNAEAPGTGQFGAFAYTIHLPLTNELTNGDKLNIQVFQVSAKDGKPIDVVNIPLVYQKKTK